MAQIAVDSSNPDKPIYYLVDDKGNKREISQQEAGRLLTQANARPVQQGDGGYAAGQTVGQVGAQQVNSLINGSQAAGSGVTAVGTAADGGIMLSNGSTVYGVGTAADGGTMLSNGSTLATDGTTITGGEAATSSGKGPATYIAMAIDAYKAGQALGNTSMSGEERAQEAERQIGLAVADFYTGGLISTAYNLAEQYGGSTHQKVKKFADNSNVMHHVWGGLGQEVFGRRNDFAKSLARWQEVNKKGGGDRWAQEADKILYNAKSDEAKKDPNWNKWTEANDPTGQFVGQDYSWDAQRGIIEKTGNLDSLMSSLAHAETFGDKWHDISLEKRREFMRRAYEEGLYDKDGGDIIFGGRNGHQARAMELMNEVAGGDISQMTPEELGSLQAPDYRYEVKPQAPITPGVTPQQVPTATGEVAPIAPTAEGAAPTSGLQKPTTGLPAGTESPLQVPAAIGNVSIAPGDLPQGAVTTAPNLGAPTKYADRSKLLWKPYSDSDGNLAVLMPYDPGGAVIRDKTTGEILGTGRGIGRGNGFAQTYRFDKPGSSYNNAVLEFSDGTTFDVTDGSLRYEDQGSGQPGENITASGGYVPPPSMPEIDMKAQLALSLASQYAQTPTQTPLSQQMDAETRSAEVGKLVSPIVQGLTQGIQ